jgi:hypothetical protein
MFGSCFGNSFQNSKTLFCIVDVRLWQTVLKIETGENKNTRK